MNGTCVQACTLVLSNLQVNFPERVSLTCITYYIRMNTTTFVQTGLGWINIQHCFVCANSENRRSHPGQLTKCMYLTHTLHIRGIAICTPPLFHSSLHIYYTTLVPGSMIQHYSSTRSNRVGHRLGERLSDEPVHTSFADRLRRN